MKPLKLAKAIALSFALGAIVSVSSDPKLTQQVQAIALGKAQATATSTMKTVSNTLGDWLKQGLNDALKGLSKQSG